MDEPKFRKRTLFPKTLAESLEPLIKPVYKKHGFAEHRILTQWPAIVGEDLAKMSMPQKLSFTGKSKEGGTLHVLVAGGRALELQHMQPVIIEKIATYFGYRAVARLAFVQGPLPATLAGKKKKNAGNSAKAKQDSGFADLTQQCDDDEMRAALLSLAGAFGTVEN